MDSRRDDTELIAQFVATRDQVVREEIILRYVPLVHYSLGRLGLSQAMGQDYEDAASQGLLGLIEAVDRYDPSYKTQFSTYATLRIRGNVIDYLRMHDWLSRGARQKSRMVQDAISVLWEKFEHAPTDEELAEYLKLEIEKLRQILVDSSHIFVSLDTTVTTEGDEIVSLHELITDENQLEPSLIFEETELRSILADAIRSLPEREQLVLSLYYYENLTFKEIGAVLDVSESRVCQLHARTVMTLRSILESQTQKSAAIKKQLSEQNNQLTGSYSIEIDRLAGWRVDKMSIITDNLLNDTLTLLQLAKETAEIRGQTRQVDLLEPVADDLQSLVTSADQTKTPDAVSSSPKIPASSELMAQNDFRTLLSVVQNHENSTSNQVNNIFSSPSNDRNQIISSMLQGGMSILDISRQMGMTRDEVQMFISMTNPMQNDASGTEE